MIESSELARQFLFSILIGVFIGLEREYAKRRYNPHIFGGIRTFILISVLGAISGYFGWYFYNMAFLFIPFLVISAFVLINYFVVAKELKETHSTTGICALLTFILSSMVFFGFGKIAVALGILIAVLLASRHYLHQFIAKINRKELKDILTFAIITLVILPFLPNRTFGPLDVFNPYHIWLMVVFVSGISFVGYMLIKIFGANKGISMMGFIGGLASSTATAVSFSEKSKKENKILSKAFALAIIIASTTMFLRVIFEVSVINNNLIDELIIPLGLMSITGFLFSYYYFKTKKREKKHGINMTSPFTLKPALKFGIFFALVLFISKAAQIYLGTSGIYVTSVLSGLADVDAIVLSMSKLAYNGVITEKVASSAITMAALSNTLVKGGIVYFLGSEELRKKVALAFVAILFVGILSIFLF